MFVDRVLLCSLLQNDRSVFAYLALAFELFALFPLWCRHVAAFAPELHYRCAALLVALLMVGLQPEPLVGSDVDADSVPVFLR